jgi:hypothetical protein
LAAGAQLRGPAIVDSAVTTIVIDPGAVATRSAAGSLLVDLVPDAHSAEPLAQDVSA